MNQQQINELVTLFGNVSKEVLEQRGDVGPVEAQLIKDNIDELKEKMATELNQGIDMLLSRSSCTMTE